MRFPSPLLRGTSSQQSPFIDSLDQAHDAALPATALALLTTFVLRFIATEFLVYLPRRGRPRPADAPLPLEKEGTP